jgi:hypothetical protein
MSEIVKNISKGVWEVDRTSGIISIGTSFTYEWKYGYSNYNPPKAGQITSEVQSNGQLIADAGTTANKCGKLPSELLDFKDYVHNRLDEIGIEKDPESEHKENGCRIGGRLDIVSKLLEQRNELLEALDSAKHVLLLCSCIDKSEVCNNEIGSIDSLIKKHTSK